MLRNYYQRSQCGFLQCRLDANARDSHARDSHARDIMVRAIEESGLTYIVFELADSWCYCVVNNRFSQNDFRKLMLDWCGRYDQEKILITWPHRDASAAVKGIFYARDGRAQPTYDTDQVEQKFSELEASARGVELHETSWPNNYSVYGRIVGITTFKRLYPHLAST